ncbi:MAG: hypothetical protein K2Y18_03785 [Alphaproteobacteria bacterium]|jgi:hypothetical protein|nr:hypothetical protein [Alphaproteobacteria bacterium]
MLRRILIVFALLNFSTYAIQEEPKDCPALVQVDETGFPTSLSYHEMDILAGGGCLNNEAGMKIMALEPQAMIAIIPGAGKRLVRRTLAKLNISEEAKAQAYGDIKQVGNRKVRTYQYIPAIGKVGGQFSVYSEDSNSPPHLRKSLEKQDSRVIEKLKRRDLVATTELQKGKSDPLVIEHFIEEQVGTLRGLLSQSKSDYEKNKALIIDAIQKKDMEAYEYLSLWLRKTDSQIIFLRQQIYLFEKKINDVRRELPQTEPVDWINLKGIFININFIHQEIDQELSTFIEHHPDFMNHHPGYPKARQLVGIRGNFNVDVAPEPHSPPLPKRSSREKK